MSKNKGSLTRRVIVALVLAITATLTLSGATLYGVLERQYTQELLTHAEVTTNQLALSLSSPLWNLDSTGTAHIVESVLLEKFISCIVINNNTYADRSFVKRGRDEHGNIVELTTCSDCYAKMTFKRDILYAGRAIGEVSLCITDSLLQSKLRMFAVFLCIATVLIDILLTCLIYYILYRDALNPLKLLEGYAIRISADTESEQSLPNLILVSEFESLRASIEMMVGQLRTRYQQLLDSKNALATAERRHRNIIDNALVGIFQTDIDGCLLTANQAEAHILGYDSPDLLMKDIHNVEQVYVDVADRHKMLALLLEHTTISGFMFQIKRPDGEQRWAVINARLVDDGYGSPRIIEGMMEDITEKKRNEEELNSYKINLENLVQERTAQLEESKRYLASLLSSLPGVAYRCVGEKPMDMEFVSQGVLELTGYAPTELIHNKEKCFTELIHPQFTDFVASTVAASLANMTPFDIVYKIITRTGDEKWVSDKGRGVFSVQNQLLAVEGFIADITERTLAVDNLRESEETFRNILQGIKAGVIEIDSRTFTVIGMNKIAEEILGVPSDEILGKPCSAIKWMHVKSSKLVEICPSGMGQVMYDEFRVIRPDGKIVPISMTLLSATRANTLLYYEVIIDITEQKSLERQLSVAQRMESIGSLAAGIAHEINTPIQYIGDNLVFLEDGFRDLLAAMQLQRETNASPSRPEDNQDLDFIMDEVPKAIAQSREGVARVAEIVQAMKRFSHSGGEEMVLLDVAKALNNAVTVTRNEWKYFAEITFDLDPAMEYLRCFAGEFNQVVLNILVNASHAINEKYKNRKDKGLITIGARKQGDAFVLTISDTGSGIKEEHLNRIFDPFFTTKDVGKGTGQGLAIVHDIVVNKHGGSIDVKSELGVGTTFTLVFPNPIGEDIRI